MKTLYLHIGIWKTGTTTIQNTLFKNRDFLAKQNILYPSISSNHTFMVSAFHHDKNNFIAAKHMGLKDEALKKWYENKLSIFKEEVLKYDSTILSSEFFLELHINKIRELKSYLENMFDKITVIVYVRHPIDHISSAINEQVKQGHYDLDKAYTLHTGGSEYRKILDWIEVFGEQNIILKAFEREQFFNNDIIDDFLEPILDINLIPKIEKLNINQNITLSYPAIEIANQLSKFAPSFSTLRNSSNYLHEIKGIKYTAPEEVKKEIMKNSMFNLEKLEKYGLHFMKKYEDLSDPSSSDIWSEETIVSLANILNDYAGRCLFLKSENDRLQANLFVKEKNHENAKKFFENAIKDKNNFLAYLNYAQFLNSQQDYDNALIICNRAIKLKPDREWPKELKQLILNNREKNK